MKEVDRRSAKAQNTKTKPVNVSVFGPVLFWIGLILIGALIQLVFFPLAQSTFVNIYMTYLDTVASYILYVPGIFILPLITALWIGSRVGNTDGSYEELAFRSVLNSLYVSVIYIVSMFMVYIASNSLRIGVFAGMPLPSFVEYVLIIPVVINVVVVPLFAILTYAKKY